MKRVPIARRNIDRPADFLLPFMIGRPAPVFRRRDEPVLHGVPVDVSDMGVEVLRVANGVFPEPPLSDAAFALAATAERISRARKRFRKPRFDEPPSRRIVMIVRRQAPDAMEMLRQDADRDRFERMTSGDQPVRSAQSANVFGQQLRATVKQVDGEEIRPTRNEQASVIRHGDKITVVTLRR